MDNKSVFIERVINLLKESKISKSKLCEDLGLNSGAFSSWANGIMPHTDNLVKIADYFKVSTDFLVGRTNYKHINEFPQISKKETELLELIQVNSFDEEQMHNIIEYIEAGKEFWR